jgi:hypothetical protein
MEVLGPEEIQVAQKKMRINLTGVSDQVDQRGQKFGTVVEVWQEGQLSQKSSSLYLCRRIRRLWVAPRRGRGSGREAT